MSGPPVWVPYFQAVCVARLEKSLGPLGYCPLRSEKQNAVHFGKGDTCVALTYWPEHFPHYDLMVVIGLSARQHKAIADRAQEVPLWYAMREESAAATGLSWGFRDAGELDTCLSGVCSALTGVLKPILEDQARLRMLLDRFRDYWSRQQHAEATAHTLSFARGCFEKGEMSRALMYYDQVPEEALSAGDRRRVYQARGGLGRNTDE